ncbi:MAG: type II secretion system protein [Sphingomonadaceae bacterium]|nr:type II secretion system protein [Sphingomonadaceae bacterium]
MRRRERGFVLLEALVATAIVGLVLAASFETAATASAAARRSAETRGALMVAQSQLAAAGSAIPLAPGSVTGETGPYRWSVTMESAPAASPAMAVTVEAGTAARPRLVTLATLKLPGGP